MEYTKVLSALNRVKEAIEKKIDAVNTSVSGLPDTLDTQFTAVKNDISTVKTDVGVVDDKVTTLDTTLTSLDAKIDKVGVDAEKAASFDPCVFKSDIVAVPSEMFSIISGNISRRYPTRYFTDVILPNCETIGDNAFCSNYTLERLNAPRAKFIDEYAFEETNIKEINLPLCETLEGHSFAYCDYVENVELPKLKTVKAYGLANIGEKSSTPIKIELPEATSIGSNAFWRSNIAELCLPKASFFDTGAFNEVGIVAENSANDDTRTMDKLVISKAEYSVDLGLKGLYCKVFDFGNMVELGNNSFGIEGGDYNGGANIKKCADALILRRTDKVCVLSGSAFNYTSYAYDSPPDNIYVPDNLVASYKKASNWSKYADRIKPLSTYMEG